MPVMRRDMNSPELQFPIVHRTRALAIQQRDLHRFAGNGQQGFLRRDQLRQGLCGDLGFSLADRSENIRRAGEVARLFFESGHIVICCFISPIARDRAFVRSLIPEGRFHETHVDCPLQVCIDRDPNGLYREAIKGEIKDFTGIASRYEPPAHPELRLRTDAESVEDLVNFVFGHLASAGIIPAHGR